MNELILLERLIWAAISSIPIILLALVVCRIKLLHPALKTWVCRIAFLKVLLSLWFAATVPGIHGANWLSSELAWFLLAVWATGALVVASYGLRAYLAAARMARSAQPIALDGAYGKLVVRELTGLPEPCVVGVLKPVLLVPAGERIDPGVLHHELAHIKHLDSLFGVVTWMVQAAFWFVPGYGRLIAEHSLWQEVWADLASRQRLELPPSHQANALLTAISRIPENPVAVLGYRGEAKVVARRIEAMFVNRYSRFLGLVASLAVCVAAIPLEFDGPAPPLRETATTPMRSRVVSPWAPIATRMNVP